MKTYLIQDLLLLSLLGLCMTESDILGDEWYQDHGCNFVPQDHMSQGISLVEYTILDEKESINDINNRKVFAASLLTKTIVTSLTRPGVGFPVYIEMSFTIPCNDFIAFQFRSNGSCGVNIDGVIQKFLSTPDADGYILHELTPLATASQVSYWCYAKASNSLPMKLYFHRKGDEYFYPLFNRDTFYSVLPVAVNAAFPLRSSTLGGDSITLKGSSLTRVENIDFVTDDGKNRTTLTNVETLTESQIRIQTVEAVHGKAFIEIFFKSVLPSEVSPIRIEIEVLTLSIHTLPQELIFPVPENFDTTPFSTIFCQRFRDTYGKRRPRPVWPKVVGAEYNPKLVDWNSIKNACAKSIHHEKRLGNFFVRSVFHDSGAVDVTRFGGGGGTDGSSMLNMCEAMRVENNYDEFSTIGLRPLALISYYYGASVTDTLHVCATVAIEIAGGPSIKGFQLGRFDTLKANPSKSLPPNDVNVRSWHNYWNSIGITQVKHQLALMGSHTLMDEWPFGSMFNWTNDYFTMLTDTDLRIVLHDLVLPCERSGSDFSSLREIQEFVNKEVERFSSAPFQKKLASALETELQAQFFKLTPVVPFLDREEPEPECFFTILTPDKFWPLTVNDLKIKQYIERPRLTSLGRRLKQYAHLFARDSRAWNVAFVRGFKKLMNIEPFPTKITQYYSGLECPSGWMAPSGTEKCSENCESSKPREQCYAAGCICATSSVGSEDFSIVAGPDQRSVNWIEARDVFINSEIFHPSNIISSSGNNTSVPRMCSRIDQKVLSRVSSHDNCFQVGADAEAQATCCSALKDRIAVLKGCCSIEEMSESGVNLPQLEDMFNVACIQFLEDDSSFEQEGHSLTMAIGAKNSVDVKRLVCETNDDCSGNICDSESKTCTQLPIEPVKCENHSDCPLGVCMNNICEIGRCFKATQCPLVFIDGGLDVDSVCRGSTIDPDNVPGFCVSPLFEEELLEKVKLQQQLDPPINTCFEFTLTLKGIAMGLKDSYCMSSGRYDLQSCTCTDPLFRIEPEDGFFQCREKQGGLLSTFECTAQCSDIECTDNEANCECRRPSDWIEAVDVTQCLSTQPFTSSKTLPDGTSGVETNTCEGLDCTQFTSTTPVIQNNIGVVSKVFSPNCPVGGYPIDFELDGYPATNLPQPTPFIDTFCSPDLIDLLKRNEMVQFNQDTKTYSLNEIKCQALNPSYAPVTNSYQDPDTLITIISIELEEVKFLKDTGFVHPTTNEKLFAPFIGYNGQSPGPTVRVERGTQSAIRFVNKIENYTPLVTSCINGNSSIGGCDIIQGKRPTSVHLHGAASLAPFDGWADDITVFDQAKDYIYPNNRAAPLWYHDHTMSITAENDYFGLAGLYIVEQCEEDLIPESVRLNSPKHDYQFSELHELHMVLQDKVFRFNDLNPVNGENFKLFMDRRKGGPHFRNLYGDINYVSGHLLPNIAVLRRPYRLTFLNAANSRPFLLQFAYEDNTFSDGIAWVIGSDGGYTNAPKPLTNAGVLMGIAERYEIIVDFSKIPENRVLYLKNGYNDDRMGADAPPYFCQSHLLSKFQIIENLNSNGESFPNGGTCSSTEDCFSPYDIKSGNFREFDIDFGAGWKRLLSNIVTDDILNEMRVRALADQPDRLMDFGRGNGQWVINGAGWEDASTGNEVSAQHIDTLQVGQDSAELWRLKGHGGWFHPVHLHLIDFFILLRDGAPIADYEEGTPKDVIYLGPGDDIYVATVFGPHIGDFMFHCHNLIHEDADMMQAFEVVKNPDGNNAVKQTDTLKGPDTDAIPLVKRTGSPDSPIRRDYTDDAVLNLDVIQDSPDVFGNSNEETKIPAFRNVPNSLANPMSLRPGDSKATAGIPLNTMLLQRILQEGYYDVFYPVDSPNQLVCKIDLTFNFAPIPQPLNGNPWLVLLPSDQTQPPRNNDFASTTIFGRKQDANPPNIGGNVCRILNCT